jgi:hypothetical protein
VATALVTLPEARAELGESTATDVQVQRWIDAATDLIEDHAGPFIARTVTQTVANYGTVLLEGRVLSVTSVLLNGLPITDYTLNTRAGLLLPTWPSSLYGAVVTYTVGLDPIPAAVREAAFLTVKHSAETEAGAIPVPYGGGTDQTFVLGSGFFLPNRAKELLAPWARGPRIA